MKIEARYKIRIVKDINDPDLVNHWKKLEGETNCFPQMYYEWCAPWWRWLSGNRTLHIVAVEDDGKIVGIAPLCIEKQFGLRILRYFPNNSVDFYSFIIQNEGQVDEIIMSIISYLKTFASWDVVHLFNINDKTLFWTKFNAAGFHAKPLTNILVSDFSNISFEQFLSTLSHNSRSQFRKKLRRLEREGKVDLVCIDDADGYMMHETEMKRLYDARWEDDHVLSLDDAYYEFRHEAVQELCKKNKMALFVLTIDRKNVIFRLGFTHENVFYDWKVSHDPIFDEFSPGILIMGKIIEKLISKGFTHFNFMAGDYPYKRSWTRQGTVSTNYEFFACRRSVYPLLFMNYRLRWRDKLRGIYYRLMQDGHLRAVSRWMQAQRKRIRS